MSLQTIDGSVVVVEDTCGIIVRRRPPKPVRWDRGTVALRKMQDGAWATFGVVGAEVWTASHSSWDGKGRIEIGSVLRIGQGQPWMARTLVGPPKHWFRRRVDAKRAVIADYHAEHAKPLWTYSTPEVATWG